MILKEEHHKKYQVIIDKSELPREVVNAEDAFIQVAREKGTQPQPITIDDFIKALANHAQIGCDKPMLEAMAAEQLEELEDEVKEMGEALGMNITELSHSLKPHLTEKDRSDITDQFEWLAKPILHKGLDELLSTINNMHDDAD